MDSDGGFVLFGFLGIGLCLLMLFLFLLARFFERRNAGIRIPSQPPSQLPSALYATGFMVWVFSWPVIIIGILFGLGFLGGIMVFATEALAGVIQEHATFGSGASRNISFVVVFFCLLGTICGPLLIREAREVRAHRVGRPPILR